MIRVLILGDDEDFSRPLVKCLELKQEPKFIVMPKLSLDHDTIQAARQRQQTTAFREQYRVRAGIEGTISAAVRDHGARRSRYVGQTRTHLQALLTATAMNVKRAVLWLMGERPSTTRPPSLRCLAPSLLAT